MRDTYEGSEYVPIEDEPLGPDDDIDYIRDVRESDDATEESED